jgi:hypothetical protein
MACTLRIGFIESTCLKTEVICIVCADLCSFAFALIVLLLHQEQYTGQCLQVVCSFTQQMLQHTILDFVIEDCF